MFSIVFSNFFFRKSLLPCVLLGGWCGGGLFFGNCHFKKLSETCGGRLISNACHPTTLDLPRLSWLFKTEDVFTASALFHVNLETETLIVSHTHEIPSGMIRLSHIRFIPSSTHDLLAADKIGYLELKVPPSPAPKHAMISGFFFTVQGCQLPIDATVRTHFDACDHPTSTCVSVSRHIVGLIDVLRNRHFFVVERRRHGRIDVELVENIFRSVPPLFLQRLFRCDVWRKDTVVMVMVMVLRFVRNYVDLLQPLDHSTADVTWDDETHRVTVVWEQLSSVGLICDENIISGIHCASEGNRCSILNLLSPWFVFKWTRADLVRKVFNADEFNMLTSHVAFFHTSSKEEITESDTLPNIG
mmetsp:Transcript_26652/g.62603  ORF Transcript_26652/g.62603 Transcript_26652/m.62603 type:complete len:358 (+) Transcript_26652:1218-2291(+)